MLKLPCSAQILHCNSSCKENLLGPLPPSYRTHTYHRVSDCRRYASDTSHTSVAFSLSNWACSNPSPEPSIPNMDSISNRQQQSQPDVTSPPSFASLARLPHGSLSAAYADLCAGPWPGSNQLPVVYHRSYNISFFGIEKLHPFDACKFGKVFSILKREGVIRSGQAVAPKEASLDILADVHTADYLHKIHHHNLTIVQVTELAPLAMLPNPLLRWRIIAPMRLHVGGTMLAAGLALERGWAINLGGGMHHACADRGSGWCAFNDIVLAVRRARKAAAGAASKATGGGGSGLEQLRVLVVDLDAHQGNGVARDKLALPVPDLHILDMYNSRIFPLDDEAKAGIDISVELPGRTNDEDYLPRLRAALQRAAATLPLPDLVIYNAGTDVLEGDALGRLGMTGQGVVQRDEIVWRWCRDEVRAPVLMLLSGGYTRESATVIATSIRNLFEKFGLGKTGAVGVEGKGTGVVAAGEES